MTQHELTVLDMVHEKVSRIDRTLNGNGDPSKGMVVRVDRLEVSARRVKWVFGALFSAIALAAAEFLFTLLKVK